MREAQNKTVRDGKVFSGLSGIPFFVARRSRYVVGCSIGGLRDYDDDISGSTSAFELDANIDRVVR